MNMSLTMRIYILYMYMMVPMGTIMQDMITRVKGVKVMFTTGMRTILMQSMTVFIVTDVITLEMKNLR